MPSLTLIFLLMLQVVFAKEVEINGQFTTQAKQYCLQPDTPTITIKLESSSTNCLTFLDYNGILANECDNPIQMEVDDLIEGITFYRILVSGKVGEDFNLTFSDDNNFSVGLCPTEALAAAAGTTPELLSAVLLLAGVLSGFTLLFSLSLIIIRWW